MYWIFEDLKEFINNDDEEMLNLYIHSGLKDIKNYMDYDKTNLGLYCLWKGKKDMYDFLVENTNLNVFERNFQGESCESYIQKNCNSKKL